MRILYALFITDFFMVFSFSPPDLGPARVFEFDR